MLPDLKSSQDRPRPRLWSANGITLLCLLLIELGALGVLLAREYHRNTPLERYKRDLRSPKPRQPRTCTKHQRLDGPRHPPKDAGPSFAVIARVARK